MGDTLFSEQQTEKSGSVPGAGTGHPGQDRDTYKYDNSDHHVDGAYLRDNKSPRNAANDKSKTDEIHYKGHVVASQLDPLTGSPLHTFMFMELMIPL
jgi:hypothetical protein